MSNGSPDDSAAPTTPARLQTQAPAEEDERPRRQLTKAEVKEQLRRRSESIDGHLEGVQRELQDTGAQAQGTAEHALQKYTFLTLGGLALAGAAVGYLLFRRKKRDPYGVGSATGDLVDQYLDAVRRDVRSAVAGGEEAGRAVDRALRNHVPLVVHAGPEASDSSSGVFSEVIGLIGRTVLSLGVTYAVNAFAERSLLEDAPRENEPSSADTAPVVGAVTSQEQSATP